MSKLLDKLLQTKPGHFNTWYAKLKDDLIVGEIVEMEEVDSFYDGIERSIIKIRATEVVSDGEHKEPGIYKVWQTYMIRRAVEENSAQVGDSIAIRYDHTVPNKHFKVFTIIVEKEESEENQIQQ